MSSAGMRIEDCVLDQEYEYPESPLMNRNNRSRRVTVTEITEEVDDWEMVTGSDEESGTTTNSEDEEMSDEDSSDDGEDEFKDETSALLREATGLSSNMHGMHQGEFSGGAW